MRSRVHVILTFALGLALAAGCSSSEDASETTTALSGEGEQAGSDTAVRQPVETDTESSASVEPVQDAASETSETDAASTVADSTTSSGEQDSFVEEEPTEPVSDSVETEGGEGEPEVVVDAGIAPDTSEPAIEDAVDPRRWTPSALNLLGSFHRTRSLPRNSSLRITMVVRERKPTWWETHGDVVLSVRRDAWLNDRGLRVPRPQGRL